MPNIGYIDKMDILLYSITLKQEDFFNLLVWFLSFIVGFSAIAYFLKQKIMYLLSIIFTFILIIKSINYVIDSNRDSQLNIYVNNNELIFITKRNNEEIKKRVVSVDNVNNLKLDNIIEKDRGGLSSVSGSTFHYKAIIYTDNNSKQKELISTRNMFDSKFISINDLDNIFKKIKSITKSKK